MMLENGIIINILEYANYRCFHCNKLLEIKENVICIGISKYCNKNCSLDFFLYD